MHSVKDFTRHKLEHMKASGGPPANLDRDAEAEGDNYGMTAARSSSSAEFKAGGHAEHGKKPHMGRQHRAHGGRALIRHDVTKPTAEPIRMGDAVKLARGGKAHHPDEAEDRALVKKMVKAEARTGERHGGRTHRADGGATGAESDANRMTHKEREDLANEKRGGRIHRASGGRAKGKTVVNVIVAGGRGAQPQGSGPMAMAPPPAPMGPPPPPPRPMMPPGGMPVGGAPMGPMGAPPGGMPMRAHGGKVDGFKNFGRGGVKGGQTVKETGGGAGALARLQKAKREGARYPRGE
jgi:hypothetical protein